VVLLQVYFRYTDIYRDHTILTNSDIKMQNKRIRKCALCNKEVFFK